MKLMTEHIPAHDRVTELYAFDELPSATRDRILNRFAEWHGNDWDREYQDTLKALEKLFGVECREWEVSVWRGYQYNLYTHYGTYSRTRLDEAAEENTEDYGYLALSGNRAMGKCWTLYGREVAKEKYLGGKKHRYSKVLFDDLHDGTCPMTGFCADNDALDPLWDMMEGKRVKDGATIAEVIDDCFRNFFHTWQKDMEYSMSEENFRENYMAEWYDADGNEVEIPEGATITDPTDKEVAA